MSEKRVVPCTDCAQWKADLEMGGHTYISCAPISNRPGFCELVFDWNFAPEERAGRAARARDSSTTRKKKSAVTSNKKTVKAKRRTAKR